MCEYVLLQVGRKTPSLTIRSHSISLPQTQQIHTVLSQGCLWVWGYILHQAVALSRPSAHLSPQASPSPFSPLDLSTATPSLAQGPACGKLHLAPQRDGDLVAEGLHVCVAVCLRGTDKEMQRKGWLRTGLGLLPLPPCCSMAARVLTLRRAALGRQHSAWQSSLVPGRVRRGRWPGKVQLTNHPAPLPDWADEFIPLHSTKMYLVLPRWTLPLTQKWGLSSGRS